jgi:hypothetical protein
MSKNRALGPLSAVISAIAFVFATLLLFVPIGEFGSVSSPTDYRGSVYDLVGHVSWLGESDNELGSRRNIVVFLYFIFAAGLTLALTRIGRANRASSTTGSSGHSHSLASQLTSMPSVDKYKRCQFCAEEIQAAAVYCKHCKRGQVP